MLVGLVADIHGNLHALESVLADLKCDEVWCIGDLVGYGAFPEEVVDRVRDEGIRCIKGNHDDAVVRGDFKWFNPSAASAGRWSRRRIDAERRTFLERLPETLEFQSVALVHGSPINPLHEYVDPGCKESRLRKFLEMTSARVLIVAHTHHQFIRKVGGGFVANPGSVGQPRDGDWHAAYGLLDTDSLTLRMKRVRYDVKAAARAIRDAGLPNAIALRLFEGW